MVNGYYIISELESVLKSGYYKTPIRYDNVEWFVIKVIKLEKEMAFYFKNTKKDIIMTKKDEEDYIINNICRFCEEILTLIKLEITVTQQVNTEDQLITNVILMSHKNKVKLYQLQFTI